MNKDIKHLPEDYAVLLAEVKERIRSAQYNAIRAVNMELVGLCWDIGRIIVERQSNAERLAEDLRREFPGVGGYSRRNIFYMREFYLACLDLPKVQPLVAQIGWAHNLIVATYRTVKRLPKELKGMLPAPEVIAILLEGVT